MKSPPVQLWTIQAHPTHKPRFHPAYALRAPSDRLQRATVLLTFSLPTEQVEAGLFHGVVRMLDMAAAVRRSLGAFREVPTFLPSGGQPAKKSAVCSLQSTAVPCVAKGEAWACPHPTYLISSTVPAGTTTSAVNVTSSMNVQRPVFCPPV